MPSILDEPEVQELIAFRKIRPEDLPILENLSRFSKIQLMSNFHNFFLQHRDNSIPELQAEVERINGMESVGTATEADKRLREICDWFMEICRSYDWATANNILRVLERADLTQYN